MADDDYPEDWQEQGWCCRECAVMAWRIIGCGPPVTATPPGYFNCP